MCTVYEFPKTFKMPKEMAERLQSMADEYVEVLTDSLDYFVDDTTTEEEYEKITEMILIELTSSLCRAIEKV